jgi:hypothetical protein
LAAAQSRHGIGGNNPPEDMQIEPQIVRETTIIWAAVEELKAETEKKTPDTAQLERSAAEIESAEKTLGAWLAEKLDVSADEFFKEFGKWGGRLATLGVGATVLWVFGLLEKLQPLIGALRYYLALL